MHQKNKDLQKRYDGFLQTQSLWKNDIVYHLKQFEITAKSKKIDTVIDEKLRLGKYIERFVSFQISKEKDCNILLENIQIQEDKRTLGELDCILKRNDFTIHLEIVYKFYLYDNTIGNNEIEHFIGPNRKDSLIEKLTKLKEKQLPLLYSNTCSTYLKKQKIETNIIKQQVYFKAQLFLPLNNKNIKLTTLNNDCIVGFYLNTKELKDFINCKFYNPNKKDWLIKPHDNVEWINYNNFKSLTKNYLERKFSPLFWVKQQNGEILKCFLVWW